MNDFILRNLGKCDLLQNYFVLPPASFISQILYLADSTIDTRGFQIAIFFPQTSPAVSDFINGGVSIFKIAC